MQQVIGSWNSFLVDEVVTANTIKSELDEHWRLKG